jgi:catechol 2,3-dioxygenase-like lactoylglutathione lyase family enzyme
MIDNMVGIHHTGMTVSDLDRSIEFYSRFGFGLTGNVLEESGPEIDEGTGVAKAHLRCAMLTRGDLRLELIQYASPSDAPPALPNNGIGSAHIAIEVRDIDAVVETLRRDGVRFTSDPIEHESGIRWCYMKDPDGITAELFEVLG